MPQATQQASLWAGTQMLSASSTQPCRGWCEPKTGVLLGPLNTQAQFL